jgi:hypothetical protein
MMPMPVRSRGTRFAPPAPAVAINAWAGSARGVRVIMFDLMVPSRSGDMELRSHFCPRFSVEWFS